MKKIANRVKKLAGKVKQDVVYYYRLTFWLFLNRSRQFFAFFSRHFDHIRQVSYILAALLVGTLVNHFGGVSFTQDILSNFLFAAGAMTGGTIAIVFTISIFLLQNASDLYSSQYLEVYIHDWREKFVYFTVILITLVILGIGLYVGGLASVPSQVQVQIVVWSLLLIGLVFALIDLQYKNVLRKINPSFAIMFLEKEGARFIVRLKYDAEKMAGIIQAKDSSVSKEMALASAYNSALQPFVSNLDRQLENLVEIAMKLSDKQEVQTTKRAFTAVHNILVGFFDARKTSSLILPSKVAFLAVESDSQNFLSRNFERLNKAGEKFIREGKDENATYIIDVYNSLAQKAQGMSFVGQRNENPILDLIIGYLGYLIDNGQRAKNVEVVFQGARVLGNIAILATQKGIGTILHGAQEKILQVAMYGFTEKQSVIVDQCTSDYLRIIEAIFGSTKIIRRHSFDDALKDIAMIANYASTLTSSGYLPNNFTTNTSMSKGYDEMYALIARLMNHYSNLKDDRKKKSYRSDIVGFFDEINSSLRHLSKNVKSSEGVLIDSIGRLLSDINELIVDMIVSNEFNDIKERLATCLGRNIHLPSWFAHHAEKFDGGSNAFRSLNESVTKTGILATEKLKNKDLVKSCVDCLYSLTKYTLEKGTGGYGYNEPRVLKKSCYLGILALKKGWRDVFVEVVVNISDFEQGYVAKYFGNLPADIDQEKLSPRKDQLFIELLHWRDSLVHQRLNGNLRIRDDAEAMMSPLVEVIDIDRFMFRIWHKFPADSEISEEVEILGARTKLVRVLQKIAKKLNVPL